MRRLERRKGPLTSARVLMMTSAVALMAGSTLTLVTNIVAATFFAFSGDVLWALVLVMAPAALIGGNIIWFLRLWKQQGMEVTCPHCDKSYTVLPGFGHFVCSECQHTVSVPRAA